MKDLYLRTLAICLFLLVLPMRQIAQNPYEHYANGDVVLNFHEIDNVDFRLYLLYRLTTEKQFVITPEDEYGFFHVSANESCSQNDLLSSFDAYYHHLYTDFQLLSKDDIFEQMDEWRHRVSSQDMMSIMMDINIARATNTNNTCENAEPFCTTDNYTFVAANTSSQAQSGPYYCCIGNSYNPSWYYMRIGNPGIFTIHMEGHDPNNYNTQRDIDFCFWGPFNDEQTPCNGGLTASKVVDCSYSSSYSEDVRFDRPSQSSCAHHTITPSVGEFYILLITNYSQQPCVITFQKVNGSGPGETDCSILPPLVDGGGPYCVGQTIQLSANGQPGASYSWTGPGGFTSPLQNPTRPNCTQAMAGTYSCTIQVGTQTSNSASTQVVVNANPVANAGGDQTTAYPGASAQLHGSGGAGSFDYHWEPNDKIAVQGQNATTVPLYAEQQFELTVTNPQGHCSSTDQMTVHIGGSAMTASASASEYHICQGHSTQLQANAGGGSGNFSYSWSPSNSLNQSNIYNPVATPSQTTTYTCHVTDVGAQTSQDVSVTIYVHNPVYTQESATICQGDSYDFHGNLCSVAGDYNYTAQTQYGCDSIITLHLSVNPSYTDTENNEAFITRVSICEGDSYNFHGQSYSAPGHYRHTFETVNHCDSVVWLYLSNYPDNGITEHPWTTCEADLPYHYQGVSFNHAADTIFNLTDIHGCDSLVRFILTINEYTILPTERHYLCYDGDTPPPFTWSANGQTYNGEMIVQTDILPYGNCQGIYSLEVHQIKTPEVVEIYEVACDSYEWVVEGNVVAPPYQTSGTYYYSIPIYYDPSDPSTRFECDREFVLHLTVNYSSQGSEAFSGECNVVPFDWFGTHYEFTEDGIYSSDNGYFENGTTTHGCDSTFRLTIEGMMYTPNPEIVCQDNGVAYPHNPITSTEFIISQYNYTAIDPRSEVTWLNNQCKWEISKDSWPIEPSADNRTCTVYAMDWVQDTVWLYFTAYNPCSLEGVKTKYYLKPSFYGIQEQEAYPAAVEIFPNPNNGTMRLHFDNIEGQLDIKVFSSIGVLTDNFQITTHNVGEEYEYSMKRLGNGIYFFVITDGKRSVTKKVVIIN